MDQRLFGDNTHCSAALGTPLRPYSFAEASLFGRTSDIQVLARLGEVGTGPGVLLEPRQPAAGRRFLLSTPLQGESGKHQGCELNLPPPEVGGHLPSATSSSQGGSRKRGPLSDPDSGEGLLKVCPLVMQCQDRRRPGPFGTRSPGAPLSPLVRPMSPKYRVSPKHAHTLSQQIAQLMFLFSFSQTKL